MQITVCSRFYEHNLSRNLLLLQPLKGFQLDRNQLVIIETYSFFGKHIFDILYFMTRVPLSRHNPKLVEK